MGENEIILWLLGGGTIVMVVLSIVLFLLCTALPFVAVFWFLARQKQKANAVQQASQTWRTTNGKVIKSRVEVTGGDTASVKPRVIYEYEVWGRVYQNDQIRAGDKFWSMRSSQSAYDVIDQYPVGMDVMVFYNPDDPAESALER